MRLLPIPKENPYPPRYLCGVRWLGVLLDHMSGAFLVLLRISSSPQYGYIVVVCIFMEVTKLDI